MVFEFWIILTQLWTIWPCWLFTVYSMRFFHIFRSRWYIINLISTFPSPSTYLFMSLILLPHISPSFRMTVSELKVVSVSSPADITILWRETSKLLGSNYALLINQGVNPQETNHDKYCKHVKKGTQLESWEVGQLHYNIINPPAHD